MRDGAMFNLSPMEEQTPKAFHSRKLLRRFIIMFCCGYKSKKSFSFLSIIFFGLFQPMVNIKIIENVIVKKPIRIC